MMVNGLPPGPALFTHRPMLFWTFIGSLVTANLMLVVLNLPLIGLWARLTFTTAGKIIAQCGRTRSGSGGPPR